MRSGFGEAGVSAVTVGLASGGYEGKGVVSREMDTVFHSYMDAALAEARAAGARGEVPVGAVSVKDGAVIAAAGKVMFDVARRTRQRRRKA